MSDELMVVNTKIKEYVNQGYNVPGVAVITELADFMRPSIRIVKIDTTEEANEVYPVSGFKKDEDRKAYAARGGKFGLARPAIQKFARAGRIELKIPNGGTRVVRGNGIESYIAKVVGERYELDGSPTRKEDEKTYDLIAREQELRFKYENNTPNIPRWFKGIKKDWIEYLVQKAITEKRKFAMEMAITGAQGRVVQKLLCLNPAYTLNELGKPFVIVSVTPSVDFKDPVIKQMVTAHLVGIENVLYQTAAGIGYPSPQYVPALPASEIAAEVRPETPTPVSHVSVEDFEAYPRDFQEMILQKALGGSDFSRLTDGEIVASYRGFLTKTA